MRVKGTPYLFLFIQKLDNNEDLREPNLFIVQLFISKTAILNSKPEV